MTIQSFFYRKYDLKTKRYKEKRKDRMMMKKKNLNPKRKAAKAGGRDRIRTYDLFLVREAL